jgi:hypothetical protein
MVEPSGDPSTQMTCSSFTPAASTDASRAVSVNTIRLPALPKRYSICSGEEVL